MHFYSISKSLHTDDQEAVYYNEMIYYARMLVEFKWLSILFSHLFIFINEGEQFFIWCCYKFQQTILSSFSFRNQYFQATYTKCNLNMMNHGMIFSMFIYTNLHIFRNPKATKLTLHDTFGNLIKWIVLLKFFIFSSQNIVL